MRWPFSSGRPTHVGWQAQFQQVREELGRIQGSTETGFLAVGGRLMEIQELAHKVRGHVEALAGLVSTGQVRNAAEVFDGVVAFAEQDAARAAEAVGTVLSLGRETAEIRRPAERLNTIVRLFETLATLAQIESARVQARDGEFGSLGVAVRDLTCEVRGKLLPIQEACEVLEARAKITASRVEATSRGQKENLPRMVKRVQEGLYALRAELDAASIATERLAAQSNEVSGAVDELVNALQFHDITRQQIEHVIEALQVVERKGDGRLAPQVASLQAAQLLAAGKAFEASAGRIRDGLARIGSETSEMAASMSHLLEGTDGGGRSFFAGMVRDISEILYLLDSLRQGDGAVHAAAVELDLKIRQAVEDVKEIQAVGLKMQRIAWNASIAAARLGQDGRPLETLADALQKLASDVNFETGQIHEKLAGAGGRAASMAVVAEVADSGVVQNRLRNSVQDLNATQEVTFVRYLEAKQDAAQLAHALESTSAKFGDQADFSSTVKNAVEQLQRLGALRAAGAAAELHDLKNLYTMRAERMVHDSLQTGADVAVGGELGDNVELF